MSDEKEDLRIEVKDSSHFVLDALEEAGREDLFAEILDEDLTDQVFVALNELVQAMGGQIEVPDEPAPVDYSTNLNALFRRRYFINIKKTAWKLLIASIPITVGLIRGVATLDPLALTQAGGSVLAALEVVRDSLKKLQPDEVILYLAVKAVTKATKIPAKAPAVAEYLTQEAKGQRVWAAEEVQKTLERMALKGVLSESPEGYKIVV